MKKRIYGLALALLMVIGLLPLTAFGAEEAAAGYALVLYQGKVYKDTNPYDYYDDTGELLAEIGGSSHGIGGTGSEEEGYTYTFTDVNFISAMGVAVKVADPHAAIVLSGTNNVTGGSWIKENYSFTAGIYASSAIVDANLTIKGDGTLNVASEMTSGTYAESMGIFTQQSLTIESGYIHAVSNAVSGNYSVSAGIGTDGDFTVRGGTVEALGGGASHGWSGNQAVSAGIYTSGDATLIGGTLTLSATVGEYCKTYAAAGVIWNGNSGTNFQPKAPITAANGVNAMSVTAGTDAESAAQLPDWVGDGTDDVRYYGYMKLDSNGVSLVPDYALVLSEGKVYKNDTTGELITDSGIGVSGNATDGYTYTFSDFTFITTASLAMEILDEKATILLEGENLFQCGDSSVEGTTGIATKSLTVDGTGSLTAEAGDVTEVRNSSCGITVQGDLTINGGTLCGYGGASARSYSYGIDVWGGGGLTVNGGELCGYGGDVGDDDNTYGISVPDVVMINDGEVNGYGGEVNGYGTSYGIFARDDVYVNGGEVNGCGGEVYEDGYSYGICVSEQNMEINGGEVYAFGGDVSINGGESYGLYTQYHLEITGGYVDVAASIGGYATGLSTNTIRITGGEVYATVTDGTIAYALEYWTENGAEITGGTVTLRSTIAAVGYWQYNSETDGYDDFVGTLRTSNMTVMAGTAADGSDAVELTDWVGNGTDDLTGYAYIMLIAGDGDYLPGDINGDGAVNIDDALFLFQHSLMPDLYPLTYPGVVDYNSDGMVNISDALHLFQYSLMPDLYPVV